MWPRGTAVNIRLPLIICPCSDFLWCTLRSVILGSFSNRRNRTKQCRVYLSYACDVIVISQSSGDERRGKKAYVNLVSADEICLLLWAQISCLEGEKRASTFRICQEQQVNPVAVTVRHITDWHISYTWKCACVCLCCPAKWGEAKGKVDAACAPFSAKTVIMACHYGVQNKGEPCSSRRAGDVLLPLFTPQLITILLNALQTARRQPSHVCVHETEGREGRGCVWDKGRERLSVTGVNARTLRICCMSMSDGFEEKSRFKSHVRFTKMSSAMKWGNHQKSMFLSLTISLRV